MSEERDLQLEAQRGDRPLQRDRQEDRRPAAISLSLSLAVLNLLAIPVLDGGQIVMSCLEKLFPRWIALRVPLTLAGLLALAAVMIYSNAQDIVRIRL